MPSRYLVTIAVALGLLAAGLLSPAVRGQAPAPAGDARPASTAPRTPWGDPNLEGVWRYEAAIPLERPADLGNRAELSAEEVAARAERERRIQENKTAGAEGSDVGRKSLSESPIRENEYNSFWQDHGRPRQVSARTSLIVDPPDGRLPYTPEARRAEARAQARYGVGPYDSFLDPDTGERCLTDGVTALMWMGPNGGHNRIVQSPGYITILHEEYRDRRIIPVDGRPHGAIRQWLGDARGHWEGDTLVVDTAQVLDKTHYEWANVWTRASDALHLTERFTRADAQTIDYEITVTDPKTFTRPWSARIPITRLPDDTEIYEYACHEGNYALPNLLSGARAEERAAAARGRR